MYTRRITMSVKTKLFVGTTVLLLMFGAQPAHADTHAPNRQISEFVCGDEVLTGVSPNFSAKAGQFLESTDVGVAFLITQGGDVVYQSPAYAGLTDGMLTSCTSDDFTFYFLAATF
jgi:hypothetical protein